MRIVFFGSGAFGLPTLERLSAAHDVALVLSQPDRPAGRGRTSTPTPISAFARERAIPVLTPPNVNQPVVLETIRAIDADAWVVIAFGQKLSESLLAERFAINLHASLLPRWRGAAPINHAILAGDPETGNSVITLAERMDAGLVLGQSHRTMDPAWTAGDLHDLLAADGPDLVLRVLADHEAGRISAVEQDESLVTLAGKLRREDAWADFTDTAEACRRRIHGLSPWPGVTVTLAGQEMKLLRAAVDPAGGAGEPGTLADPDRGVVACGNATGLRLVEVQPAGRRPMTWEDYARGRRPERGAAMQGRTPC
ncbi:MAG: methionyl-tRNA formyltransferase [Phycisphaerales bacterium]